MEILLVDGGHLAHRNFWAMLDMKTSMGISTGAVYGFLNSLKHIMNPEFKVVIVAWDEGRNTFRHKLAEKYKDKGVIRNYYKEKKEVRPEMKNFYKQLSILRKGLKHLGIQQMSHPDYEADDIIGTLANKYKEKYRVYILSGDKDYYQLLDKNVSIIKPDGTMYYKSTFIKEYGIQPKQWIALGALSGDCSDKIQGVDGIGEKRALELIKRYKGIKPLLSYKRATDDDLQTLQKVLDNRQVVKIAYKLKKIVLDVSLLSKMKRLQGVNKKRLYKFFMDFEFKSFNLLNFVKIFGGK